MEQEGEGGLLQTSSSSRGSSIAFRDMSDGSGKRARRTSKVTSVVIVACVLVAAAALLPRFFPFGTTQSPTANGAASASTNDGGFIGDLIRMIPGYGTGRDAGGATKNEAKPIAYADLFNGLTNLRGLWFEFTGEVMTDEGGGVFCVNVTKDESEVMGAFMPYKDSVALYVEGAADFHVGDIIHFVGQSDGSIADSSLGSSVRMPKIIAAATDISVE
ncbi:MAG: hypothetical protein LBS67_00105 [Clostridiales Family XIII bacterium]|nr:hypothetical protein [Clostridiales Family XIII bacterium]